MVSLFDSECSVPVSVAHVDDGRDKPRPRTSSKAMETAGDNLCLLRATSGKRKIRTVVSVSGEY